MTNNNINPEQPRATPSNPKQTLSDSKQPRGLISLFYVTDYLVPHGVSRLGREWKKTKRKEREGGVKECGKAGSIGDSDSKSL